MIEELEKIAKALRDLRTAQQGACLAIEAKHFLELLTDFHEEMCSPEREHLFWLKMVNIRSEYIEELERLGR